MTLRQGPSVAASFSEEKRAIQKPLERHPKDFYYTSFSKQEVLKAFAGDYKTALLLLYEWDRIAEKWIDKEIPHIRRLPSEELSCASLLLRRVIDQAPCKAKSSKVYLPQSWSSACYLLSLLPPEQIAALPQGFRTHYKDLLLPSEELIPLESSRYNSELFACSDISVAYVSDYSHPATVEALQRQGITVKTLSLPKTLDELVFQLLQIGQEVDRAEEAQLLGYFCKGLEIALQNKLSYLKSLLGTEKLAKRPLLINVYNQWYTLGSNSLSAQLAEKVGLSHNIKGKIGREEGLVAIGLEEIVAYDPDLLIISSDESNRQAVMDKLSSLPLCHLTAVKQGRVAILELQTLQELSHYLFFAYFQLADAIEKSMG